jgi:hypothetical protein
MKTIKKHSSKDKNVYARIYDQSLGGLPEKVCHIKLGKVDYNGIGQRKNSVELYIATRPWQGKSELSIMGEIWNGIHTDMVCAGQCYEELKEIRNQLGEEARKILNIVFVLWHRWHLHNDLPSNVLSALEKLFAINTGDDYENPMGKEILEALDGLRALPDYA